MANCAVFLSIFAYTILIFCFEGWPFALFFAVNCAAMIRTKISPLRALRHLVIFIPFILLAAAFNLALGYAQDALYLSLRLILICNITQCYKKVVSANDIAGAIETLCSPFKTGKVRGKDIGLMVCISLAFIPVLRRDFTQISLALQAKGMKMTAGNMKYLLKPFFIGILQRTDEIAKAIRTKGYDE
jgi:energy-coupling factor transporter transmembrane protein EcfT